MIGCCIGRMDRAEVGARAHAEAGRDPSEDGQGEGLVQSGFTCVQRLWKRSPAAFQEGNEVKACRCEFQGAHLVCEWGLIHLIAPRKCIHGHALVIRQCMTCVILNIRGLIVVLVVCSRAVPDLLAWLLMTYCVCGRLKLCPH